MPIQTSISGFGFQLWSRPRADAPRSSGAIRVSLLKALTDQTRPVFDGVAHEAAVDVVEFLMICPLSFHIVDFKAYIRRHPTSHSGISEKGRNQVSKA